MKRFFLLCALIGFQVVLNAQKVYFIYLQSDNAAPFYVRIGGQIQSSSLEGYLIIPKLRDSTYQISIGQPGKQMEPRFSINISKADRGFLIRTVDGTISLFDLQTLTVYKPITTETSSARTITRTDNFTRLLAVVADDSSLLSEPVVMTVQRTPPQETNNANVVAVKEVITPTQDVEKTATSVVTTKPASAPEVNLGKSTSVEKVETETSAAEKPVVSAPVKDTGLNAGDKSTEIADSKLTVENSTDQYKKSVVTKKSESSTSEGFGLVFLDQFNGSVDTIELIIPNPRVSLPDTTEKKVADTKQFLDISNDKDNTTAAVGKQEVEKLLPKAHCASLATDDDFFKLRRDMTAKSNDEEMIAEAKKHFKAKCYRTEQIKYLTALFLTEESKYQFFDAAYMHVSDQEKFKVLQMELKDNYYINRFKALIAN